MTQRDDEYITRDMLTKNSYEGNNFAEGNVVKYDLQNGKINVICFCSDENVAKGIAEGLNLLDNLEADGIDLKSTSQTNTSHNLQANQQQDQAMTTENLQAQAIAYPQTTSTYLSTPQAQKNSWDVGNETILGEGTSELCCRQLL